MRYPDNGTAEIYSMFADGSGVTRLTNNSVNDDGPVWSPDGTKLAFSREVSGLSQIFVMNDDGSNEVNLSNGSGPDPPRLSSVGAGRRRDASDSGGKGISRIGSFANDTASRND